MPVEQVRQMGCHLSQWTLPSSPAWKPASPGASLQYELNSPLKVILSAGGACIFPAAVGWNSVDLPGLETGVGKQRLESCLQL